MIKKELQTFFSEKDLEDRNYNIEDDFGNFQTVSTNEVIDFIINDLSPDEQKQVHTKIVQLDFVNADFHHFLEFIAKAMVESGRNKAHIVGDQKFELGHVVSTPTAMEEIDKDDINSALRRYVQCDWGDDMEEEDWEANDDALEHGGRLLGSYKDKKGEKFWIITEHDRSVTTILLPSDY